MGKDKVAWTKPQQDAIEARGGTVLVSAAAGSGKTAVLVERVVGIICDEDNPVDVDKLLIVTFSNAAAAEMRQRVGERLLRLLQGQPGSLHLQRQYALLQKAQISTVHSFCLSVVRDHFQDLDISADFSIADESELELMRGDAIAECMERFYKEDGDGSFADLVELLTVGKDDRKLIQTVFKIYEFSRSHPFYEDWLAEKQSKYVNTAPIAETDWGKTILAYTKETIGYCAAITEASLRTLDSAGEKLWAAYHPAFQSDHVQLARCAELTITGEWDALVHELAGFTFTPLKAVRGDDPVKDALKASRGKVKDALQSLAEKYLCATEEESARDIAGLSPKIRTLFRLVTEYGRAFWEAKSAKKRLDFSDLEHLTLGLLVRKTARGYEKSIHAGAISQRYEYVLVDEYQDTNEAQDLIFASVSRDRKNLFMVGDVKQSIYSFRQAMPEIFLAHRRVSFPYDGIQFPASIDLDTNFRSRREVTEAVNFLFERIMSRRIGEIDYDARERLECGAVYPHPGSDASPELLLLGLADYGGDKSAAELEADAVAGRVAKLLEDGYTVKDGERQRPAMPRDICILLRSPKDKAKLYVDALTRKGVAAWSENAGGFLSAREVSVVLSLLKAVDNPLLDVELVAALASPLIGFTDDDIAEVRLTKRGVPFYSALVAAKENGHKKSARFLSLFDSLRRDAHSLSADRLLLRLYERTYALELVRAMPMGEGRRANLLLLIQYAEQYHALGYKRLAGFVGFLSRLEERGGDLAPANAIGIGANIVRVMSIHRSKGLEFPIVVLADTAKQFNLEDLRANTILHSHYGFACVRREYDTFKQYPTIPLQAIRLEAKRSQLSEEMRVLYVALTRAKEKLIISGAVKGDIAKKLYSLDSEMEGGRLPSQLAGEAKSFADWILMSLLRHSGIHALRERAGLPPASLIDDGNPWRVDIIEEFQQINCLPDIEEKPSDTKPDPTLVAQLHELAAWEYPYRIHTQIPAKLTVSAVAKGKHDVSRRFTARPAFLMDRSLTPAERGNAMHKFMQFADYEQARKDISGEISRMQRQGFLSKAETDCLSCEKLEMFFTSPLANRIFASEKVYRELKFMAMSGKDELMGAIKDIDEEAGVVLNGVADCVFIENGRAVIVDYKTDHVISGNELRDRYGTQLRLYAYILKRSLNMPVEECVIYSFALSQAVMVNAVQSPINTLQNYLNKL